MFKEALAQSVELLKVIPKWSPRLDEAKALFARHQAAYPAIEMELVPHVDPQRLSVDYDVLLQISEEGIAAVSFTPDESVPWCVLRAEHSAANLVVSVNQTDITVQQVLLFFKQTGHAPDLMDGLIDAVLVEEALQANGFPVSAEELQRGADAFRRIKGLHTASSTNKWLHERNLDREDFERMMRHTVLRQKLKEKVAGNQVDAYFHEHRAEFESARIVHLITSSEATVGRLTAPTSPGGGDLLSRVREAARTYGASGVQVSLETVSRGELNPAATGRVFAGPPGAVVGPEYNNGVWEVFEVMEFHPAQLDRQTRQRIKEMLFQKWLEQKREAARIIWHWM
jgi:putative peptide maturation system protein